ncbi:hypothetical protein [Desulfoscipio gibsoniae]
MKAIECNTVQTNDLNLFYMFKLVEENVLINEPEDGWWLTIANKLSQIDFVAILAIVIADYDQCKQKALWDEVYKIKPMPHESSEDSKLLFNLFKAAILEPELYLEMVHNRFGDLPLAELKTLAKPLLTMQGKSENKSTNGIGLRFPLERHNKAL